MAVKYLWNSGDGSTGNDWTHAYTTLSAACAALGNGDTLWVADTHTENLASAQTYNAPAAPYAPVKILCANTHATTPPTGLGTGAVIGTSAANNMTTSGYAYVYGLTFNCGDSTGGPTFAVRTWKFENCNLNLNGTSTAGRIAFGGVGAPDYRQELINCTMKFGNASQGLTFPGGAMVWRGGGVSASGVAPTSLFILTVNTAQSIECSGLDLSFLSGKNLVAIATSLYNQLSFRNCKLPASINLTNAVVPVWASRINFDNCDSGNTNWKMSRYMYQGSVVAATDHYRSAGASDGSNSFSHLFSTYASGAGPSLYAPLEGPWMTAWNDTPASYTLTIELCTENVTLYDDDVWIEVEYPGTSGYPQAVLTNTRCNSDYTTHQTLTTRFGAGAGGWTGFTTPSSQRIQATFTTTQKGVIRARVMASKASATVYVDPMITVT